jgi:hypothetical protein
MSCSLEARVRSAGPARPESAHSKFSFPTRCCSLIKSVPYRFLFAHSYFLFPRKALFTALNCSLNIPVHSALQFPNYFWPLSGSVPFTVVLTSTSLFPRTSCSLQRFRSLNNPVPFEFLLACRFCPLHDSILLTPGFLFPWLPC